MKRRALKRRYGRSSAGRLVQVRIRRTGDQEHIYGVVVDSKDEAAGHAADLRATKIYPRTNKGVGKVMHDAATIIKQEGWIRDNRRW